MAESVYGFDKKGFDRVDRVVQAVEGVMQPRPRKGRRPPRNGGGGGDTTNLTKFAYTVDTGYAVLLDEDMNPVDEHGDPLIVDPVDPDYDAAAVDAAKVPFTSAHDVEISTGVRITLSSVGAIMPGDLSPTHRVWGMYVNVRDYLAAVTGFGAEQILFSDAGAGGGDIKWDAGACGG